MFGKPFRNTWVATRKPPEMKPSARNALIRHMFEDGSKPTSIAKLFNLEYQTVYSVLNSEKIKAGQTARYKLRVGGIRKGRRCERCNQKKRLEMHHPDYSRPLCIEWLCRRCHRVADSERREAARVMRDCPITIKISSQIKTDLEAISRTWANTFEDTINHALIEYVHERTYEISRQQKAA